MCASCSVLEYHRPRVATGHDRLQEQPSGGLSSGGAIVAHTANRSLCTGILKRRLVRVNRRRRGNDDHVGCVPVKSRNGHNTLQLRMPAEGPFGAERPTRAHKKRVAAPLTANLYSCPAFGRHSRPEPRSSHDGQLDSWQRGGVHGSDRPSVATASLVPNLANTSSRLARRWEAIDNGTRPQLWIAMWTTVRWSVAIVAIATDEKEGPRRWTPLWTT
jgi:hypothetical protein